MSENNEDNSIAMRMSIENGVSMIIVTHNLSNPEPMTDTQIQIAIESFKNTLIREVKKDRADRS